MQLESGRIFVPGNGRTLRSILLRFGCSVADATTFDFRIGIPSPCYWPFTSSWKIRIYYCIWRLRIVTYHHCSSPLRVCFSNRQHNTSYQTVSPPQEPSRFFVCRPVELGESGVETRCPRYRLKHIAHQSLEVLKIPFSLSIGIPPLNS